MSFKKFGGLNYSAKNNIVGNLYSSSTNSGTANIIGLENSKITSQSHLDMSANSVMHIGSLYFMDGTIQSTAYANSSGTAPTFGNGIIVNNGSQLNGGVTVTGSETITGGLTTDALTVSGTSSLGGAVTASNGLTVSSGNLTVSTGSTTVQNLNVIGTASINNLTVTGTFTFTTLTVTGNLTVTGTSTLAALNTSGLITANAGLTSTAATNTLGTANITTGNITTATIGTGGLNSTAGFTTLASTIVQDLTASGLITGNAGLIIPAGQTLTVSGTTSLQGTTTTTLTSSGLITASAGLTSTLGATTLGAATATSINIAGATLGLNVLAVNGTSSLQGATTVTTGGLSVTGGVTVVDTGLTITAGGETITAGDLTVTAGAINANGGSILSTATTFNLLTDSSSPILPSAINFGNSSATITIPSIVRISADFYNGIPLTAGSSVTAYFDNVNIDGTLVFNSGSLFTVNNLQVNGYANISGATTISDDLTVNGNLNVTGSLNFTNLVVSGTLTVAGNTIIGTAQTPATLTVNGLITGNSGLTVSSGATSLQATTTSALTVTGSTSLQATTINNGLSVAAGSTFLQATTVNNGLIVATGGLTVSAGATSLQATTIQTGNLTVSSGSTSLQATDVTTLSASDLITALLGLVVPNGQDLTVNSIINDSLNPITISTPNGNNINIGSTSANTANVFIVGGGNAGSSDTVSTSNAGFIVKDGGAFIQQDLMVFGGNIYGPNAGTLNVGSSNDIVNIGNPLNITTSVNIMGLGSTSAGDTNTTLNAALNVNDGGVFIQGDLKVNGGNIFGPDNGTLSIGGQVSGFGPALINLGNSTTNPQVSILTTTASTDTTTGALVVAGGVGIAGSGYAVSFNNTSDYRIKEDVQNLNDGFNVDNLRPVTYKNKKTEKQDIGFIAHEVQEEFPYLVSGEKDGEQMQSLNYIGLIGVLVKEIQELKKRVSILENR